MHDHSSVNAVPVVPDDQRAMAGMLHSAGIFHCDSRLGAGVALELPPLPDSAMLHLVLEGTCSLVVDGSLLDLGRGDLVLLPHGRGHALSTGGRRPTRLEDTERPVLGGIVERLRLGDGPTAAHVVCAALSLHHPAAPPVPDTLAEVVVVRADEGTQGLRTVARLLEEEVRAGRPGWVEVASRLVDVIAMQAVRIALDAHPLADGLWAAVRDPAVASALRAVTRLPHAPWTVDRMARTAGLSRSAFAQRFAQRVGEAPMAWVTRYRMGVARGMLAQGEPVSAAARAVGYDSEVAFRRAFARTVGVPPGAVRRGRAAGGRSA